jgi:hypothetical protein
MISFFNENSVVKNIRTLISSSDSFQFYNLRNEYHATLNVLQGHNYNFCKSEDSIYLQRDISKKSVKKIISKFLDSSNLDEDEYANNEQTIEQFIKTHNDSHKFLQKNYNQIKTVVVLLIGNIIPITFWGSKGAASDAAILGMVLWSVDKNWDVVKHIECLIHEATHQAHFLDEMIHGSHIKDSIFVDSNCSRENYILSPILNIERPIDMVLAAAYVAMNISLFHKFLGNHDDVNQLVSKLKVSVNEMIKRKDCFSANGIVYLYELEQYCQTYN